MLFPPQRVRVVDWCSVTVLLATVAVSQSFIAVSVEMRDTLPSSPPGASTAFESRGNKVVPTPCTPVESGPVHPVIASLRDLVPEANVAGEHFARSLPHPQSVSREDRTRLHRAARNKAVESTLQRLVAATSLPPSTRVSKSVEGDRVWPHGHVGSVAHKGTLVLAAMASTSILAAIGIDLERRGPGVAQLKHVATADEMRPISHHEAGTHLCFSAKEAAFKAWFATRRRRLSYSDIKLSWDSMDGATFTGTATGPDLAAYQLRCKAGERWVIAAAIQSATRATHL